MTPGRRRLRGLAFLVPFGAVAGIAVGLVALLGAPGQPPVATAEPPGPSFTTEPVGPGSTAATFTSAALRRPGVGGFSLILDAPLSAPAYAAARMKGYGASRCTLVVEGGSRSARFDIDVPLFVTRLDIPCPGLPGFLPERFRLSWPGASPSRSLGEVLPLVVLPGAPIPAELGTVVSYLPGEWRDHDFEVFRWAAVPSILVFDTASYAVQDRLFKRLAFFVEKKGYTGTIPDFNSIAALHGFNAHDYRARDLARFFAAAHASGIRLLAEESRLEENLLDAGVLARDKGTVIAGTGGVLSVSRETATELRTRLLTHEALHGLYFTSTAFRTATAAVWDGAGEELKKFLRLYLSRPVWGYDLSNAYLLVNEFMAYLLQYTEEEMLAQLYQSGIVAVREQFPSEAAWLGRFAKSGRAEITAAYRTLEELLWRELGVGGGRLVWLRASR